MDLSRIDPIQNCAGKESNVGSSHMTHMPDCRLSDYCGHAPGRDGEIDPDGDIDWADIPQCSGYSAAVLSFGRSRQRPTRFRTSGLAQGPVGRRVAG